MEYRNRLRGQPIPRVVRNDWTLLLNRAQSMHDKKWINKRMASIRKKAFAVLRQLYVVSLRVVWGAELMSH